MDFGFRYTVFIGRADAEVWNALTTRSVIDRYYIAPVTALELKTGGRISYGSKESDSITGVIAEIDEPRKLVHSFRFMGSDDPDSIVTYEIKALGGAMCVLDITHTGFAIESQAYADIAGGWPVIASSLKTLLETGEPLPWPKG
jgi:uncharacterized protein YndB with AHSA1/START domain